MNAKLQNTALSLDEWTDDDDTPEFSDDYLEQATVKLSQNGQVIAQAKGLTALSEKLRYSHFKHRTAQNRMQLIQMREMMQGQRVAQAA